MKKTLCFFAMCSLLALVAASLYAQTAIEVEDLLKIEAVDYGQAARFVLKAADAPVFSDPGSLPGASDAFNFAAEQQWLPKKTASSDTASLEGISFLIMRSFGIKGGLFYSLFRNPHYAYREMVYQEIIQGRADPDMTVSGERLLFMINRVIARMEVDSNYAAPAPAPVQPDQSQKVARQQTMVKDITTQLQSQNITNTTVRVTDEGVTISLSNIQFLANSAELPDSEKGKLDEIGAILKAVSMRKILVSGHTALAGTPEGRMKTSLERAQSVAAYLVSKGVRGQDEISVQGFGSDRPIADNDTPEGMALNRRVEITILENQQ